MERSGVKLQQGFLPVRRCRSPRIQLDRIASTPNAVRMSNSVVKETASAEEGAKTTPAQPRGAHVGT